MKDFLKKDINIKIVSILIAIVLWFYVMDVKNPEIEYMFKDIPVKFTNTESIKEFELIVMNKENPVIDLKVKGRRKTLYDLKKKDVNVTADLSGHNRTGEFFVPVDVEIQDENIEILSNPKIKIKLDKNIQIQKQVEVVTKGSVKSPYVAFEPKVTPNNVTLKGPSSIINMIDSLKVLVDLTGQSKDVVTEQKYEIYNKNGEKIINSDIVKEADTVEVVCPILKMKNVPIKPNISGSPAKEYTLVDTKIAPEIVRVAGKPGIIDKIKEISTEEIKIDNLREDKKVYVPIVIDKSLRLIGSSDKVNVQLDVEKLISRTFTINNIRVNNISEDLSYRLLTKELEVRVKGLESSINDIDENSIYAYIDVKDYDEGEYEIPVNIKVYFAGAQVMDNYSVMVKLSRQKHNEVSEVLSSQDEIDNKDNKDNSEDSNTDNNDDVDESSKNSMEDNGL